MDRRLTDRERAFRDQFVLDNHENMNIHEIARHFDVATSTIRAVCDRLGVKTKLIPRKRKDDTPIKYDPKIDPALLCFQGVDNRPNATDRNVTYNGRGKYV